MSQQQDPSQYPPAAPPSYGQAPYPPPAAGYQQPPYGGGYQQPTYGPDPTYGHYAPAPTEVTAEDRTWSTVSHAGSFVAAWAALGILCPILVLVAKPSRPFVRHHAYESLNFQLNALGWVLVTTIVSVVTLGLGAVFFIPVALWYFVFVIVASVKANAGEWYRYPLIVRVFNP